MSAWQHRRSCAAHSRMFTSLFHIQLRECYARFMGSRRKNADEILSAPRVQKAIEALYDALAAEVQILPNRKRSGRHDNPGLDIMAAHWAGMGYSQRLIGAAVTAVTYGKSVREAVEQERNRRRASKELQDLGRYHINRGKALLRRNFAEPYWRDVAPDQRLRRLEKALTPVIEWWIESEERFANALLTDGPSQAATDRPKPPTSRI